MKYSKQCEHCGHKEIAYIHVINKAMIGSLYQLQKFYEVNKVPANLQKDLNLTKNQYNNFQKLQHFGVVYRSKKGWIPTILGRKFIYGVMKIPKRVATIDNEVIAWDHEAWSTHNDGKIDLETIHVRDYIPFEYKQREEYQKEKGQKNESLF